VTVDGSPTSSIAPGSPTTTVPCSASPASVEIFERKARERELERLERLNAVIRTIDETMVAAETRDEIETAIVREFASADAYRFAVIAESVPR